MDIIQALINMIKLGLSYKNFATGSKGFYGAGKITVDGVRYQAQAQAVLIGSKGDPNGTVRASVDDMTAAFSDLLASGIPERTFRTGRTGYRTTGKIEAGGQRYQVSVQAVRLA